MSKGTVMSKDGQMGHKPWDDLNMSEEEYRTAEKVVEERRVRQDHVEHLSKTLQLAMHAYDLDKDARFAYFQSLCAQFEAINQARGRVQEAEAMLQKRWPRFISSLIRGPQFP